MKNLRKNLIITMVMVSIAIIFMAKGVNANSGFTLLSGGNSTNNTAGETTTLGGSTGNTTKRNIVKVNNINTGDKDLPQTGENDIYIVTGIGILAIAIGGFAYIKSKRFE